MKNIALNILAVLGLLAIIAVAYVVLTIYSNPASPLNPFPPPTLPANMVIPTSTMTPIMLPATWTPQPAALTEARRSSTPIPSATTFKLITNTPIASPTETSTEVVLLPSDTPTALAFFCMVSIAKPLDGGNVEHDSKFDGSWIIKNGGTETWDSSQVEARDITGTRLQTKAGTLKLLRDVPPGSSIRMSLDLKAPTEPGTHFSTRGTDAG